jgi:intein-encoded DNA endonuclease-like protein
MYYILTTIKWCKSSQTVFIIIKVFRHKFTLKFLGDYSLTPRIEVLNLCSALTTLFHMNLIQDLFQKIFKS